MQTTMQALKHQIEARFSQLQIQLAQGDTRSRRDAAYALYEELGALRQQYADPRTSHADAAEGHAVDALLTDASHKAWSLYSAYHQELQNQLEWASTREYE